MTIKEIKQTDWFKSRPLIIQQAVEKFPPTQLYRFKESGKQCMILSFGEPKSGKFEDVTCTVKKTGVGGVLADMGLTLLDIETVFGVKLDDLEPWEE